MNASDIIRELKKNKVLPRLSGDKISLSGEIQNLSPELIELIRDRKSELVAFLNHSQDESMHTPITPSGRQENYPVTNAQKRVWILSQFDEGSLAYNIVTSLYFQGDIVEQYLEMAFLAVMQRHESLRTVFTDIEGELRQVVLNDIPFQIKSEDIRDCTDTKGYLKGAIEQAIKRRFDLEKGPLIHVGLFRISSREYALILSLHHIISDGWSIGVIIKEMMLFYDSYSNGSAPEANVLNIHYKDYTGWMKRRIDGVRGQSSREFWKSILSAAAEPLDIPADFPRPERRSLKGALTRYYPDKDFYPNVLAFCKQHHTTPFNFFLSTIAIFLSKASGQNDITIGTPVSGRNHFDLESQVGLYVNTLPLRSGIKWDERFVDFLKRSSASVLKAFEYQEYPFDLMVEDTEIHWNRGRNPLFEVMLVLQDTLMGDEIVNRTRRSGLELGLLDSYLYGDSRRRQNDVFSKFDLTFNFGNEPGDKFYLEIEYATLLFKGTTVDQFFSNYLHVAYQVMDCPEMTIASVELAHPDEKHRILTVFNATDAPYPGDKTVIDLFKEQVNKTPDKIALVFGDIELSYKELNERSNRLGRFLRQNYHIQADDLIAVQLDPGEWMVTAILAVLKSGGAYVPIDPEYPGDRIRFMLTDSNCKVLIDEEKIAEFLEQEKKYDPEDLTSVNVSTDLMYVMYTSGSTGRPKGCMLEHRGIINRIEWMWYQYAFDSSDVILQKTTFTFDVSVWELFMPLCKGAKMVLCKREDARAPERLLSLIEEHEITCLHFVPAMLNAFKNSLSDHEKAEDRIKSLRRIITSGEALPAETVSDWYKRFTIPIHNLYGPTEASVDVTYYPTSPHDTKILIGRPIWNTRIYILDQGGQLQPPGVIGEICIGGDGLARGYWNRPDLMAEKFLADPFRKEGRIYRTGDLGRWSDDGNIEFIGRKDEQVKIRGYRIEPGEVENVLQRYQGIDSAVVIAKEDTPGEKSLIAYIAGRHPLDIPDIRAYLGKTLPTYMIPAYFVQLEQLPLSPNGKIDRKKLPAPERSSTRTGTEYIPPRNRTEEKLILIWQEILGKREVGIKDDFFHSGGHSLKATSLASLIYKEFEVKIGVNELFSYSVLEDQAQLIRKAVKTTFIPIPPAPLQEHFPLSSSQRGLWVISQLEDSSMAYHMSGVFEFSGKLNRTALTYAFKSLIQRHEILRTVFRKDDTGDVRQYIREYEESGFDIQYLDLRDNIEQRDRINTLIGEEQTKSFDLSNGPLLRAGLWQTADDKWIFCYVMHHIGSDGWSMEILIRELLLLYNGYRDGEVNPLSPLKIQYKDYAVWQQGLLKSEAIQLHKEYWLRQLGGELPVLELPCDRPRPAIRTYNGSRLDKMLNSHLTEGIKALCDQQDATLFMGMLSAVDVLLFRYTRQTDIIVGSPIAGREHPDLEDQIGFYVNTLVLRTRLEGDECFMRLIDSVKSQTLDAYAHQAYPFDELADELRGQRDMSRNALFDVAVVLQNTNGYRPEMMQMGQLQIRDYGKGKDVFTKFDLTFTFEEREGQMQMSIEYNKDIYGENSIERLAGHFGQLLAAIIRQPLDPIRLLDYLNEHEKRQLLVEFSNIAVDYPRKATIVSLFEQQAKMTPRNIAVTFRDTKITYRELNERANRLGDYLRKKYGIKGDDLVCMQLERGEWMIVAMLGILKAGGAYVPVDIDYPPDRVEYMIADSQCKLVIDQDLIAEFLQEAWKYSKDNLPPMAGPQNLAYVIYTSGTTGYPKGVLIEHRNVVRLLQTDTKLFDFNSSDVWTMFHSYCFDFSVWEIYGALLSGGRLIIIPLELTRDPHGLLQLLDKEGVTILNQTPSSFYNLANMELSTTDASLQLRYVIFGGEALNPGRLSGWRNRYPGTKLINMYGITETTVHVTYKEITALEIIESKCNIGRPLPTLHCYVLDEDRRLLPIGVPGELYVEGEGLARGYLNRDDLNNQRFVISPFNEKSRLYRSGDKVKLSENGEMEYIGRLDDQIKIRGYRIEIGEIENALQDIQYMEAAVVLAKTDEGGNKSLVAYMVSRQKLSLTSVRAFLTRRLPNFMIPSYYVQVEKLPLTGNGKLDRKALPDPKDTGMSSGVEYIAPRNDFENKMVKIWEEILGGTIGVRDNFFESGGDSIRILQMTSEMEKQLNVKIPVSFIYKNSTIEDIGNVFFRNMDEIEQKDKDRTEKEADVKTRLLRLKERVLPLMPLEERENIEDIYHMSTIERGMLFESALNEEPGIYHDQFVYLQDFPGFEIDRFRLAINLLVEKHSILRTSFNLADDIHGLQIVHKAISFPIGYEDLSGISPEEQLLMVRKYLELGLKEPFIASAAPIWRIAVLYLGKDRYGIVWQFHHAILDGWSNASFMTELNNLYFGLGRNPLFQPGKLKSGYKDFIVQHIVDQENESLGNFWKNELAGFSRLDVLSGINEFKRTSFSLNSDFLTRIKDAADSHHTSVKNISLSAYLYMLWILNYNKEILCGIVTNTRPDCADGDKILGCFLNSVPLRVIITGRETGVDLIDRVNNKLIELRDYERLSLSDIAQACGQKQQGGNPFFDVLFNFVDFHIFNSIHKGDSIADGPPLELKDNLLTGWERTNTYFDFTVGVTAGTYDLTLQMTKQLRSGLSMERIKDLFLDILTYMVDSPDQPLSDLELIRPDERRKLLTDFNDPATIPCTDRTIVAMFEDQVGRTPDNIAIVYEDLQLTYKELNEYSNQLAGYLQKKYKTIPDDRVGVKLQRNEWLIISIFGILKSGAAYLPIDIGYPQERIDYISENSRCKVIIDERELEIFLKEREAFSKSNGKWIAGPNDLAYVIYTSGSSGRPKGVMIEHRNVSGFINWCTDEFRRSLFDMVFFTTSICFDLSVFELFYTLCNGKKLRVLDNALAIPRYLKKDKNILLNTVPSVVGALLGEKMDLTAITVLNMAGEPIPKKYIECLDLGAMEVRNLYGPSESTTYSSIYRIENAAAVLIGRPIAGTDIYILNAANCLQPIGVMGEICIGGTGLARGYLNDPLLTEEKFAPNPFKKGERIYKTGDLGRWLPDGNLEFAGRIDDQVKIRGHRIEPGEVENALRRYPGVDSTVALAKPDGSMQDELVAYFVSQQVLNQSDIRTHLKEILPFYMVPSRLVQLDELPLLPNGKIDKNRLSNYTEENVNSISQYTAPGNEIEENLVMICQDIFGKARIGVTDNFFDLGGHSLKMVRLISWINKEYSIQLNMQSILKEPTIESISEQIAFILNRNKQKKSKENLIRIEI